MPQLVSVSFKYNPKPLWFDPRGKNYTAGAEVLVETERGREVGTITNPSINATNKEVEKLKSPLKPVIRELNELDYEHIEALNEKGKNAMPYFRDKAKEYELDIKPVEVQYLFSGERAVFYFSSEERVDFRDLVRDLAQQFHIRIDMRQIGARDEAKQLGGIAHCGEEFCCSRFGGEFQPVSIRMAKEQDLPLNPSKISGVCGRLMCCLRYEYEAYKDFKKRAPKKGTPVDTPLGEASISGYNTPRETMELKLDDGKRLNVPLAEMSCCKGKDGCTRCSVNAETFERCAPRSILIALGALDQQLEDMVASPHGKDIEVEVSESSQGGRRRRRRSTKRTDKPEGTSGAEGATASKTPKGAGAGSATGASKGSQGTKESGASRTAGASGSETKPASGSRRRRRRNSNNQANTSPQKEQAKTNEKKPQAQANNRQKQKDSQAAAGDKPRPGQNSSGLRKRRSHAKGEAQGAATPQSNAKSESSGAQTAPAAGNRRKPRRRHDGSKKSE